jgi:hypothetical protein
LPVKLGLGAKRLLQRSHIAISLANDLHIITPFKITVVSFCLMMIDVHIASSF